MRGSEDEKGVKERTPCNDQGQKGGADQRHGDVMSVIDAAEQRQQVLRCHQGSWLPHVVHFHEAPDLAGWVAEDHSSHRGPIHAKWLEGTSGDAAKVLGKGELVLP
eukprot:CAMPEP_0115068864 /NCGR_PEP_ID=MMETSP0227-20121206/12227_1 /TAXON_ID=89957 /ORGANISM="Polarella glacialis, Strain CCMP 1383" /LENGTH=105 /DNA_ID=CAMNT_0002455179 /DNA_START=214 /DNA_END=532 /DNA_ORIENTATION=-